MRSIYFRLPLLLGTTTLLAATLALACTSETPSVPSPTAAATGDPTPSATPTTPTPAMPTSATPPDPFASTPTPSPTPDLTRSRAVVDQLIEAVQSGDVAAVEPLITLRDISCAGYQTAGPSPACDGDALSTAVAAFPAGVCRASWYRDPAAIVERFVTRAGPLIAVTDDLPDHGHDAGVARLDARFGQVPSGDFRVIFQAEVGDETLGYVAIVDSGAITYLQLGCRSVVDAIVGWPDTPFEVLIRGEAFIAPPLDAAASATPDPLTAPRGQRSGDAEFDRIIDAMSSRAPEQIAQVVAPRRMQCTHLPDIGSPPPCEDSELEATVVDAFLILGCEGSWVRADEVAVVTELAARDVELYAIVEQTFAEHLTLFVYASRDPEFPDTLLYVSDGSVVGYATLGCSTAEDFGTWYSVQFRGPAWPE